MSQIQNQSIGEEGMETATLGGGCFWCVEAVFDELRGIKQVESGYSGGLVPNPNYYEVCSGTTGHAEVVQIIFDPKVIPFREILEVFFMVHDPTTSDRQGADVGTQYRSVILYHSLEQKATAEQVIKDLEANKLWKAPIVTEITPFEAFFAAEEDHQEYFRLNGNQPYCQMVISPKITKFRKAYRERLKA